MATIIFGNVTYGSVLIKIYVFYKKIKSGGQKSHEKIERFIYK